MRDIFLEATSVPGPCDGVSSKSPNSQLFKAACMYILYVVEVHTWCFGLVVRFCYGRNNEKVVEWLDVWKSSFPSIPERGDRYK